MDDLLRNSDLPADDGDPRGRKPEGGQPSLSLTEMEEMLRRLRERKVHDASGQGPSAGDAPALAGGRDNAAGEAYPADAAQSALWRLHRADPSDDGYHEHLALRISGKPDIKALDAAYTAVVARHPGLRSTFHDAQGRLIRKVHPAVPMAFEVQQVPDAAKADPEDTARELAEEFLSRPFDLSADFPIRALLLRLSPADHLLVFVLHHIQCDNESRRQLAAQFSEAYNQWLRSGSVEAGAPVYADAPAAVPLPAPIADPLPQPAEAEPIEWPFERARLRDGEGGAGRLGIHRFRFGAGLHEALADWCAGRAVTPFRFLLSTYLVLLNRLMGDRTYQVGVPYDRRLHPGESASMGLHIRVIPLAVGVSGHQSFDALLAEVGRRLADGIDATAADAVTREGASGMGALAPLRLQTLFNMKEDPSASFACQGLSSAPFRLLNRKAKADLSVSLERIPATADSGAPEVTLSFDTRLMAREDAERLAARWVLLIRQCMSSSDRRIGEYEALLPDERERVCREWAGAGPAATSGDTLHGLVLRTAASLPGKVAVRCGEGTLTYSELVRRSAAVAAALLAKGARPDRPVALLASRSTDTLAAILGILRAGAAYMPLDTESPPERLARIVAEAAPSLILTDRPLPLEWAGGIPVLPISGPDTETRESHEYENLPQTDAAALAYVIHTSGSSGRPKGAMVEHRNIVSRLLRTQDLLQFGEADRALQKSPLSFDVSIPEIFLPLISGGTVVLPDPVEDMPLTPKAIGRIIEREGVTYVHFLPPLLRAFLEDGFRPSMNGVLRTIWCGGEALDDGLMRACLRVSDAALWHGYGPTETAVGVTAWRCDAGYRGPRPPIGTPIAGNTVRLLNSQGRPVPPGSVGEVCIGGAQVGRGYLNDPEEQRRRFIPDPFEPEGGRLYLSGDLARHLPDGTLEFVGRADDQVKVLGHRVEPGEVSTALRRCAGVADAAVVAVPHPSGGHRLVAFVVTASAAPGLDRVRRELSERIPAWMMPADFLRLDAIPVDARGKTDRAALRRKALEALSPAGLGGMPATATERLLAEVWAGLLSVPAVSRDDDFFRLGGNSLMVARMAERLGRALGREVGVTHVYAYPKLADLARQVDAMGGAPAATHTLRAPAGRPAPMSPGQRRMWLLQQLHANPSAYHISRWLPLEAAPPPGLLRLALTAIAERHAVLRTRLLLEEGEPVQAVDPVEAFRTPFAEMRLSPDELPAVMERCRDLPFDMAAEPCWRAVHFETAGDHALLLVFHHAVADEQALAVLLRDLKRILDGGPMPSAADGDAPTYADFSYQRWKRLQAPDTAVHRDFWKRRLQDIPSVARLTPDAPADEVARGRKRYVEGILPEELHARLKDVRLREGRSAFSLHAAVLRLLLYRTTGNPDVLFVAPVSERTGPRWQEVVGFFLNTLPLRLGVDKHERFTDLWRRETESLAEALAHADLPFEEIAATAGAEEAAHMARTLAQVMLAYKSADADGIAYDPFLQHMDAGYAKHDIVLTVTESDTDCRIGIAFDASRYQAATMEKMLERYLLLLETVEAAPERPVSAFDILLPVERECLRAWNDTRTEAYAPACIHGLFSAQALAGPSRVAVRSDEGYVTYGDLDCRSGRIAAALGLSGVRRDVVVALWMDRSPALSAAMLGIWKAGGACLLVDTDLPPERVAYMVRDSGAVMVLTDGLRTPEEPLPAATLTIGELLSRELPSGDDDILVRDAPSSLAYIVYTSGTTGRPKGAMVEHRNIVNRLLATRDMMAFQEGDSCLQKSPLSFDVCMTELLLPLVCGGAVVFPEVKGRPLAPEEVVEAVTRFGATYVHFVPSMLRAFLQVRDVERVNGVLRHIRVGGEALPRDLMNACLSRLTARVFHTYGPAETAVAVTCWECVPGTDHPHPPIGMPHTNTYIRLLDAEGMEVPPGAIGEIFIGGAQVGRGYVSDPALTAARFVPDPADPSARLYRTGDLAWHHTDGLLLFAGRIDDQIKLNGQRIEPGEVAAALCACEGVADAAVLAMEDAPGERRLHAWIAVGEGFPGMDALRERISLSLPPHMIPSRLHLVREIPRTAHGKLDRRALAAVGATAMDAEAPGVPPMTQTETLLASLWGSLLGRDAVGRDDDFFALGGNSLLALRMLAALGRSLPRGPRLADVYACPRLSELAARIEASQMGRRLPPAVKAPEDAPLPMSEGQRRLFMLQRLVSRPAAVHVTRLYTIGMGFDDALVKAALTRLAERHEALRTRLRVVDEEFLQEVSPMDAWALPWTEAVAEGADWEALLERERERPFDLSQAPLWRVCRLVRGMECHLYFTFHHAIMDQRSMQILFSEFRRLLVKGPAAAAELPPLSHRFADFAWWQRSMSGLADRVRLDAFWKEQLADLSEVLRFGPEAGPLAPSPGGTGRAVWTVPERLVRAVAERTNTERTTPFVFFLSVFQALLGRLTGHSDILIGTPVSERGLEEWRPVVGYFLNTIPIRLRVDTDEPFRMHCGRTRAAVEECLAHADLPYREIAAQAEEAAAGPFRNIVQVMFSLQESEGDAPVTFGYLNEARPMSKESPDDLHCIVDIRGRDWKLILRYEPALFGEDRIRRMGEAFLLMLRQAVKDPMTPVGALPIATEEELSAVYLQSHGPRIPVGAAPLLHRRFEWQAVRTPEATALEYDGRTYTYRALDALADAYAAHLRDACGLSQGETLAILLPSSDRLVAWVLAALKCGAAVQPIDPALPEARILFMLEDSGARNIVVPFMHTLEARPEWRFIEAEPPTADSEAAGTPSAAPPDDAPAYLMYTSGSTGRPKGVYNTHRGFTNMVCAHIEAMGIGPSDRVMQVATPSFDVSLYEIFLALHSGATLVVPHRVDLAVLPSFIVESRVSVGMLTPMVIGALDTDTLSHLRVLISGGEEARTGDAARLHGKVDFYNAYGPTEASVWTTLHRVARRDIAAGRIPIGRPMRNTSVLVLDRGGNLLPPGVEGELHIGGIGISPGYHNRPGLSRLRYVPDPFRKGEWLYRTGDLARWDAHGGLHCLGRKDGQVKVMGTRIETAEIEAAMESLPEVARAVVISRRRMDEEAVLVAFAVLREGMHGDAQRLRLRLSAQLPPYMIPARFHPLERIPLTHNGKVDRRALERFDEACLTALAGERETAAGGLPATDTERRLAAIWSGILDIPVILRRDNFFSLGGDSLKLVRLLYGIQANWSVETDLQRIYAHMDLDAMAALIDEQCIEGEASPEAPAVLRPVPVWDTGRGRAVQVMVGGAGSVEEYTKYHRIGASLGDGYRLSILPDPAGEAGRIPVEPLEERARECARCIVRSQPKGPYLLLGDCIGGIDAYATATELQELTEDPIRVVMMDTLAPGPPRREYERHRAAHHHLNLPGKGPLLQEMLFGLFLLLARIPFVRALFHVTPRSRRQAEAMAVRYGLFEPHWYAENHLKPGERRFRPFVHHVMRGWAEGRQPAPTFNAYRYAGVCDAFSPSADDAVLHALYFGLQSAYVRRKTMEVQASDNRRRDIIRARTFLRREAYRPKAFRGDVDLVVSSRIYARNPTMGWERHVEGGLHVHPVEGDHKSYLRERLPDTAETIRRILETDPHGRRT